MHVPRLAALAVVATLAASALAPLDTFAATPDGCRGSNLTQSRACTARWEAANIHAHLDAGKYDGQSRACLAKTAHLLETYATSTLGKHSAAAYAGPYPCGKLPSVATSDDGVLARSCTGAVWRYASAGLVPCRFHVVMTPKAATSDATLPAPASASPASVSPSAAASATPAAASAATAAALPVTVAIKDFAFTPATIAIAPGQAVTFKNDDAFAHTVAADDKSFDSGNMNQNATFSHVFATPGTYKYTCAYHAYMHGTIIVK